MPLSDEQRQEVLAELRTTREMLADIPERLKEVEETAKDTADSTKHTRWAVYGLVGALVAVLCVVLWVRLSLIQDYQKDSCVAGNEARAAAKDIFDTLFFEDARLAEQMGEEISDEEQAALDRIYAKVLKAYPQRDCDEVSKGNVVDVVPSGTPGTRP